MNDAELLEELAKLEHEQWCHWINYQLGCSAVDPDTGLTEDGLTDDEARAKWESWADLAQTPYEKLTEKQKDSDRVWARKVLNLIKKVEAEKK